MRCRRSSARDSATDFTLETRYAEPSVTDRIVGGDATTELSSRWYYGWPALGGSEDGRTRFYSTIGFIQEGITNQHTFRPQHPQYPKSPAAFAPFCTMSWRGIAWS